VEAVYEHLRTRDDNPAVVLPTGCHAKGHPILMYDGTVKPVEQIRVGDELMGPDSQRRRVLALCRGEDELFRIRPRRGEAFVVNAQHVLSLVCTREGKPYPSSCQGGEIEHVTVAEYLRKPRSWKHLRKLYRVAVDFPGARDLPIPPYVLGLLLGDGCLRQGCSLITADEPLADSWERYADQIGCDVTVFSEGKSCPTYSLRRRQGKYNVLTQALEQLGLAGQDSAGKFIPHAYLTATRQDRLGLLAGLMDTDGSLKRCGFEITTKSQELAADIVFLARSLGFGASCRQKYSYCQTGAGGWFFRIHIYGDLEQIPTRLTRKQASPRRQKKSVLRTGFSVEPCGRGPFYGFVLDGDHRYVDGHFMVHHNSGKSWVIAQLVRDAVLRWKGRVLILAHVKELLQQNAEKIRRLCPEVPIGIYSAGLNRRETDSPVIVAGIQSAYKRAAELGPFDLVIVDECFPAGTKISTPRGHIAIEDVSIGQPVHTALGVGEVEAISARPAHKLLELEFENGGILRCTPNHLLFTEQGWREAQTLEVGSRLFSREDVQILRSLDASENLHQPRWQPQGVPVGKRVECPGVLFGEVRRTDEAETAPAEAAVMAVGQNSFRQKMVRMLRARIPSVDQAGRDREDDQLYARAPLAQATFLLDLLRQEGRKCHVDTRRSNASQPDPQTAWPCAGCARRQREAYHATDSTARNPWATVVPGVGGLHGAASSVWVAEECQDRPCPSAKEDRHRTGRSVASVAQETRGRQTEGLILASQRVVRITAIECQSPVAVFNLQVAGHPSYYAGGVLAHNCHLIPPDGEGMYRTFLADAKVVNPHLRVIGLTATPFRLSSGPICTPEGILNHICYEVGVRELIRDGYLCPLVTKAGINKADFGRLHVRGGEFVADEVEALMDADNLVIAACSEIVAHTHNRQSVLVFTSGVKHGRHVARVLAEMSGQEVGFLDGQTPAAERAELIARFRRETTTGLLPRAPLKYLVNVNVLTTGFDAPNIDCVAILRPTMSPGLWYQCVGRGFRLHPGKQNCLVLDFGGNALRHGPVDQLKMPEAPGRGSGEAPAKECPECHAVIAAGYATCPECGHKFPPPERQKHDTRASEAGILSGQVTDTEYEVHDVRYSVHIKRDAPPDAPQTMRVDYRIGQFTWVSEWVCFEHTGYARWKAEQWWRKRSPDPIPETAERAVEIAEAGGLAITQRIVVRTVAGEKFDRIVGYTLGPMPEPVYSTAAECDLDDVPF